VLASLRVVFQARTLGIALDQATGRAVILGEARADSSRPNTGSPAI